MPSTEIGDQAALPARVQARGGRRGRGSGTLSSYAMSSTALAYRPTLCTRGAQRQKALRD
eukprot:2109342-Rhodomonas_salina.1